MFGTYRYILACMVVLCHLAGWANAGSRAVFGFYLISGYLMAFVLNRTYGFSPAGTVRFLSNRALRIYPPYLFVIALTLIYASLAPQFAVEFKNTMSVPRAAAEWFTNLVIFGMHYDDPVRLIPPTWSLYAELFFYVGMALGLARSRRIAIVWFGVSAAYTIYMAVAGYGFEDRYYPVSAASLPFSMGALVYHFDVRLRSDKPWWALLAVSLFLVHGLFTNSMWREPRFEGFYVSLVLALFAQVCLLGMARDCVPSRIRRLDRFLGDIAYPIFLCHWVVGSVVSWSMSEDEKYWGILPFGVSLVVIHLLACAIHMGVERPIARWRDRIRRVEAERESSPLSPAAGTRLRS